MTAKKQPNRQERKRAERSNLPTPKIPKSERIPRKVGRPSTCTDKVIDEATWYLQGGWQLVGDQIPSVVGLACELNVIESQLYDWAKINERFSLILANLKDEQHRWLLQGGITGKFNPTITKLILGKHGYSDKVDSTVTNPDGSLRQQPTKVVITGRKPQPGNQGWDVDESADAADE